MGLKGGTSCSLLAGAHALHSIPPAPPSKSVDSHIFTFCAFVLGLSVGIFLLECGAHYFRRLRDGAEGKKEYMPGASTAMPGRRTSLHARLARRHGELDTTISSTHETIARRPIKI
ncbi:MAG: hypothetical protein SGPRY_010629 [Prymnesium sp.]